MWCLWQQLPSGETVEEIMAEADVMVQHALSSAPVENEKDEEEVRGMATIHRGGAMRQREI